VRNSIGNDVHADEKNLLSGCIDEIKEIITRLNLQNSGLVPIRFFGTYFRTFTGRSAARDTLAAVFRIRGWFYNGESYLPTASSTTAISSGVIPHTGAPHQTPTGSDFCGAGWLS
jgi:hypothetical protein